MREGHELAATFVFPSLEQEYRAKAEDYVSHFVGHEGAGSLLSTLKARTPQLARSPGVLAGGAQSCSCPGLHHRRRVCGKCTSCDKAGCALLLHKADAVLLV